MVLDHIRDAITFIVQRRANDFFNELVGSYRLHKKSKTHTRQYNIATRRVCFWRALAAFLFYMMMMIESTGSCKVGIAGTVSCGVICSSKFESTARRGCLHFSKFIISKVNCHYYFNHHHYSSGW